LGAIVVGGGLLARRDVPLGKVVRPHARAAGERLRVVKYGGGENGKVRGQKSKYDESFRSEYESLKTGMEKDGLPGRKDSTVMAPNGGSMSDLSVDDIVPPRRRRRQLRTGLDDHVMVVAPDGEVTLVPADPTQPTLGVVRATPAALEDGQAAGTAQDPIIL
jgi:hypothetical protein